MTGRSIRVIRRASQSAPTDDLQTPLDQLDRVLVGRKHLRLRVVCPSQEFAAAEMAFGVCRWLSCSRGIWESLMLGTERDLAVIMLQAPRIGSSVVDYLFTLLPAHARDSQSRHALIEIDDARDIHLSEKILARTSLIARLRSTLELAREHGHHVEGLSCYSSSLRMAKLADRLGADLIDAYPALLTWGTKSGSRQVFHQTGVRHPLGSYHPEKTLASLAATLNDLTRRFGHGRWMVKADHGFGSGHGNAIIDTTDLASPLTASVLTEALRLCSGQVSGADYVAQITSVGAIAEQVISSGPNDTLHYPSALGYLRRDQDGHVDVMFLGVHDQVLGSSGDYVGCRFPASPAYRIIVAEAAGKVLTHLAVLGVTGHVGIDFIAVVSAASAAPDGIYATEINLRQTGTTHPHRIVRAAVPGDWNSSGTLIDRSGREVCYKGTDGIISPRYIGVSSATLVERLQLSPHIAFNQQTRHGVIPHLWPSLERCGKIGATFIGASTAECDVLESDFIALLEDLAVVRERHRLHPLDTSALWPAVIRLDTLWKAAYAVFGRWRSPLPGERASVPWRRRQSAHEARALDGSQGQPVVVTAGAVTPGLPMTRCEYVPTDLSAHAQPGS